MFLWILTLFGETSGEARMCEKCQECIKSATGLAVTIIFSSISHGSSGGDPIIITSAQVTSQGSIMKLEDN